MKPFLRVLVGLDLTEMDYVLLHFICRFVHINPFIEDLYFIHVEKNLENTLIQTDDLRDKNIPKDELFKIKMQNEVEHCLKSKNNINIHYKIVEGDPLKQLLHWAKIKFIDLIIAGKKTQRNGSGILMEKLARKSNCSILFVPQNFKPRFKKILIPVDFTRRTDNVFETASMINDNLPHTQFTCQHVVEVPAGYTRIGKSFDEFSQIMVGHAKERWVRYAENHPLEKLDLRLVFTINENGSIAKTIINYAQNEHIDMIMMGSKRQTDTSAFILGSVGEELVRRDKDILLLLVKDPVEKKTYDFFKAMKKI